MDTDSHKKVGSKPVLDAQPGPCGRDEDRYFVHGLLEKCEGLFQVVIRSGHLLSLICLCIRNENSNVKTTPVFRLLFL